MICVYTFDLDGTIINSASDIASSVNEALKKFGYWTLDEKQIQTFIGDGARKLILRSLNASTKNHFSLENEYNRIITTQIQSLRPSFMRELKSF